MCRLRNVFFPRGLSVFMINDVGHSTNTTMVGRFPPGTEKKKIRRKIAIQRPLSKSETFRDSGLYAVRRPATGTFIFLIKYCARARRYFI